MKPDQSSFTFPVSSLGVKIRIIIAARNVKPAPTVIASPVIHQVERRVVRRVHSYLSAAIMPGLHCCRDPAGRWGSSGAGRAGVAAAAVAPNREAAAVPAAEGPARARAPARKSGV